MSDTRFGMLIDLSLCIGCNACAVACKEENDVPTGADCFNVWVESWDVDRGDGYTARVNLPKQCNHCANPVCVSVCPTGATFVEESDGTVQVNAEDCIGCGACVSACPYGARWIDPETDTARKCTFCHHRSANGLLPACVATCVSKARIFGDLNDPESDISKRLAAGGSDIAVLLPDEGLEPSVRYVGLDRILAMPRTSAIHKGGNVLEPYAGYEGAAQGASAAADAS